MEIFDKKDYKYKIMLLSGFKKDYKRIKKQHKDISKLEKIVIELAKGNKLDVKYRNHKLNNDKNYKDCYECHIEPDWLLIYSIEEGQLIIWLTATGSHSELFKM